MTTDTKTPAKKAAAKKAAAPKAATTPDPASPAPSPSKPATAGRFREAGFTSIRDAAGQLVTVRTWTDEEQPK